MLQHTWSLAPEGVTTSPRSCSNYTGYQYDSEWNLCSVSWSTRRSTTWHHRICQMIASWFTSPGAVIHDHQTLSVHYHLHQFTSWRWSFLCCRTTPLEHSSYTCPPSWFVFAHIPPQTKNVFNCSRHQHLVTVAFRRCVQTFLLTYKFIDVVFVVTAGKCREWRVRRSREKVVDCWTLGCEPLKQPCTTGDNDSSQFIRSDRQFCISDCKACV